VNVRTAGKDYQFTTIKFRATTAFEHLFSTAGLFIVNIRERQ